MPPIILDLSRLLSRVLHATPTGIDRVEMAYARGLLASVPDRLRFAAVHPGGLYGRLPEEAVKRFLDDTETRWSNEGEAARGERRRFAVATLLKLRPLRASPPSAPGRAVYVQSSPHHLTRPKLVASILKRERARFVCMVHDVIPLEYPEYARPGGAERHRVRIETITRHADGIVANSAATLASIRHWIDRSGRTPLTKVAHIGTAKALSPEGVRRPHPYFICIATIEPRKNHLLLLHIWRRLAETYGTHTIPRLVLIGRRGWENEQVLDLLDRCPALHGAVEERSGLPDREVHSLLAGARALLLPSFAEGYGMPVAEALSAGVPVICSDLPALREVGVGVPEYLDPLDGRAWMKAILDYADPDSAGRARQLAALAGWTAPDWPSHIDTVLGMVDELSA